MYRLLADTYDRIILWVLVVQYVFVNLIFTTYTQNIVMLKDLSAPLLSILVLALWICGDLAKYGRWTLPKHGVVPPMVAALLLWLVPTIAGTSTASGTETWGRMFCYFVQVWAAIRFVDSFEKMGMFLRAIVITNLLIVFYGLTQIMGHDLLVELGLIPDWGSYVFVSTHGNPNFLAGYLIATFPTIIGYWLITRNPVLILTLPVLVILNLFEVIKSEARGAYLAVALCMPIYVIGMAVNWRNLHIVEDALRKRFLAAAGIALLVVAMVGGIVKRDKVVDLAQGVYNQFYTMVDFGANYTNMVRLVFFQMALDGALRYPVLGRGIGSFNWQMPETRPVWYHRTGVSHNTDHPHNEHLEWLHDGGLLGLTVFWWILAAYFWTGLKEILRHRRGYHFPLVFATFLGPWMQWIQGTFDVETRWTGNGVTMWMTLGLALAFANLPVILKREEMEAAAAVQPAEPRARRNARPVPSLPAFNPSPYLPYAATILALVLCFYGFKAWEFWRADHHLRNNMGFTDAGSGNANYAIQEAEKARELAYATTSIYYKLAYSYLVAGRLEDALQAYRDLQTFAPNYAQIHINLAYLNDQMGFRTASAWERDRASAIEHNTRNHRDAAAYWLQLGYPMRAIAHMHYCFTIDRERLESGYFFWYDVDNIHTELARIYAGIGRNDLAEFSLNQALQFNPANTSAALIMAEVLGARGEAGGREALMAQIERHAPDNPALLVMKLSDAVAAKNYDVAIDLSERVADAMPIPGPGAQSSQESQMLGNTILQALQTMFGANFRRDKCLEIAGWIYASQGRFQEAESFLNQSFQANRNPKTVERLALVRARLRT